MDCPGIEPLPVRVRPATNRLSLREPQLYLKVKLVPHSEHFRLYYKNQEVSAVQ